ncbi:hypothetical protein BDV96DRAFT_605592 [Lophiotrema nucula]|uniref:Uncharacterized protein n=1 Tax=Lophiotrema nucula TaxID=690887 RepID=A0A6A5YNK7_9PLEO|nr:hypothetical protein BDV96DRAFT_605592 [Lophiotrema nucula]
MDQQDALGSPTTNFSALVDEVSASIFLLLKTLKTLSPPGDILKGLDDNLRTFYYSLLILVSYSHINDLPEEEAWWDHEVLQALLRNAALCLSRTSLILNNVDRSDPTGVDDYLRSKDLEGEVRHLRLRLHICIDALHQPVHLSAMRTTFPLQMRPLQGAQFRCLALESINTWIEQTSKNVNTLARDGRIPTTFATLSSVAQVVEGVPDLHWERKNLVKTVNAMIATARDMMAAETREEEAGDAAEAVVFSGRTTHSSSNLASTELPYILTTTLASSNTPAELPVNRGLSIRNRPSNLRHSRPSSLNPRSQSEADDTQAFPTETVVGQVKHLSRDYTNALTLLANSEGRAALELFNKLLPLYTDPEPPAWLSVSLTLPSRPRFLLDMARAHRLCHQDEVADNIAKELLTSGYYSPFEKYEALHILAYEILHGERREWMYPENLVKAKEYCIATVKGRTEVLGRESRECQESVDLLATLCEKCDGAGEEGLLGECLEVLRGTFEGVEDRLAE